MSMKVARGRWRSGRELKAGAYTTRSVPARICHTAPPTVTPAGAGTSVTPLIVTSSCSRSCTNRPPASFSRVAASTSLAPHSFQLPSSTPRPAAASLSVSTVMRCVASVATTAAVQPQWNR